MCPNPKQNFDEQNTFSFMRCDTEISANTYQIGHHVRCKTEFTDRDDLFALCDNLVGKVSNNKTSSTRRESDNDSTESVETIMPYTNLSKTKKALYTPLTMNYQKNVVEAVSKGSLYSLREVVSQNLSSLKMDATPLYQIQPNARKVRQYRDQIEKNLKLYYKMTFYNKIKIDYQTEFQAIKNDLSAVANLIDSTRPGDAKDLATVLLFDAVENEIVDVHRPILEAILNTIMPAILKLQKELYTSGYLDDRNIYLNQALSNLIKDINNSIITVSETKRKFELASSFSKINQEQINKFQSLKTPQQIYEQFVKVLTWVKMFKNEAGVISQLRKLLSSNLKAAVIVELFEAYGDRLYELDHKMVTVFNLLQKKVKTLRSSSPKKASRVNKFKSVNVKKLVEEGHLEKSDVSSIQEMMKNLESFVSQAEKFCNNLSNKKDEEIIEMFAQVEDTLNGYESSLKGLTYAKEIRTDMEKSIQKIIKERNPDISEEEITKNHGKIKTQLRNYKMAIKNEVLTSSAIANALNKVYEKHMNASKKRKFELGKGLSHDSYIAKMAKIVRKRLGLKNELMTSSYTRVQKSVNLEDVAALFKSKKVWNSLNSNTAHLVSVEGSAYGTCKPVSHKIYVNMQMEMCLLELIKEFVGSLV